MFLFDLRTNEKSFNHIQKHKILFFPERKNLRLNFGLFLSEEKVDLFFFFERVEKNASEKIRMFSSDDLFQEKLCASFAENFAVDFSPNSRPIGSAMKTKIWRFDSRWKIEIHRSLETNSAKKFCGVVRRWNKIQIVDANFFQRDFEQISLKFGAKFDFLTENIFFVELRFRFAEIRFWELFLISTNLFQQNERRFFQTQFRLEFSLFVYCRRTGTKGKKNFFTNFVRRSIDSSRIDQSESFDDFSFRCKRFSV